MSLAIDAGQPVRTEHRPSRLSVRTRHVPVGWEGDVYRFAAGSIRAASRRAAGDHSPARSAG